MIDRLDMPPRIAALPVDHRGFPVPKFVQWVDGKPDFRQTDPEHWQRAVLHSRCWICGEALGRFRVFVCGPLAYLTRMTSEPPSHRECAEFAVRVCPFIAFPQRKRDEKPEGWDGAKAVVHLDRNPGVWILWTSSYRPRRVGDTVAIELGEPTEMRWVKQNTPATLADALAAINPILPELIKRERPDVVARRMASLSQFFVQGKNR